MVIVILLFLLGFILLIKGGDWFVDGAAGIAHRFHIPEILIGATVVSIGTTLPEVMVSATSALSGHGEMAYGNAIGSVICNTALIAALSAAIRPSGVEQKALKVPVIFFFIAAAVYAGIAYTSGFFSRSLGMVLLAIFVIYLVYTVMHVLKDRPEDPAQDEKQGSGLLKDIGFLVLGATMIAVGADLLVDNGTQIAQWLGVPESVIALTFVALGTSLPELVTSVSALVQGHSALSLGNVIGANLFNLTLVTGASAALAPFGIPQNGTIAGVNSSLIVDFPVMLLVMLLLTVPALSRGKLSRAQGLILLGIYAAFCIFQFAA